MFTFTKHLSPGHKHLSHLRAYAASTPFFPTSEPDCLTLHDWGSVSCRGLCEWLVGHPNYSATHACEVSAEGMLNWL